MKKNRGRRLKLLKGEKMMYGVIVVLIALIPILNVYTSAVVTRTNIEVEELKSNIEKQTQDNESLTMQIDELASLENIQADSNLFLSNNTIYADGATIEVYDIMGRLVAKGLNTIHLANNNNSIVIVKTIYNNSQFITKLVNR